MDYSKFYTPPQIATLLVDRISVSSPNEVVDICCGSCNLLHAAKKRWNKAQLIGVDIDQHASPDVIFTQMDGRKYATESRKKYSLVLANPPFDFVESIREFPLLFQGVFSNYNTKRLENEMLIANLLLLQENGTLVIILPSTFVEATTNATIRSILGKNYHICEIIKLANNTFGTTNINSYALIIKNSTPKKKTTLYSTVVFNGHHFMFADEHHISQDDIASGDWCKHIFSIAIDSLDIRRGNISSQMFSDNGIAVLHTAKKSEAWVPSLRYSDIAHEHLIYAEHGDILVSRIGKSAGQWCLYKGEKTPISDCLFRIKDPSGQVFNRIKGHTYNLPQKGVATRYITMNDFRSWYSSLPHDDNETGASHQNEEQLLA